MPRCMVIKFLLCNPSLFTSNYICKQEISSITTTTAAALNVITVSVQKYNMIQSSLFLHGGYIPLASPQKCARDFSSGCTFPIILL